MRRLLDSDCAPFGTVAVQIEGRGPWPPLGSEGLIRFSRVNVGDYDGLVTYPGYNWVAPENEQSECMKVAEFNDGSLR